MDFYSIPIDQLSGKSINKQKSDVSSILTETFTYQRIVSINNTKILFWPPDAYHSLCIAFFYLGKEIPFLTTQKTNFYYKIQVTVDDILKISQLWKSF